MPSTSQIAHAGLPFANPMSEAAVDRALGALRLPDGARLLETGCGSGELLLRALGRDASWSGVGVDLDADAIEEAERRAHGRPATFTVGDASEVAGTFDAVLNVASSHAHGGFPAALGVLRSLLAEGGNVVYGEGYWMATPSGEFLQALGGATIDELPDLAGLRSAVSDAGFEIVHEELAGEEDWAAYELALVANAERHGDADALAYAGRIRERRALPDGGRTLGFALLVLRPSRL